MIRKSTFPEFDEKWSPGYGTTRPCADFSGAVPLFPPWPLEIPVILLGARNGRGMP
jgi:hypothetical protein